MIHEDDLQHEVTQLGWREYVVRELVVRSGEPDTNPPTLKSCLQTAESIVSRVLAEKAKGEQGRFSLAEMLVFDLLGGYDTAVCRMGPMLDVAVCERGHVIDSEDDPSFCGYCEGEAESAYERRMEG